MRDRLVELLKKKYDHFCDQCGINKESKYIENLADYLLANGVVCPPCKVGDKVYVIEPCTCYNNYSEFDKCHHKRTKATKWIEMVRVPKKHFTKCLKLFERPFKIEYLNNIGKTVFLTKEEAEKKINEVQRDGK